MSSSSVLRFVSHVLRYGHGTQGFAKRVYRARRLVGSQSTRVSGSWSCIFRRLITYIGTRPTPLIRIIDDSNPTRTLRVERFLHSSDALDCSASDADDCDWVSSSRVVVCSGGG